MTAPRCASMLLDNVTAVHAGGALCTQGDELRAYKEIATLQDVDVELPADTPTDYAGAAEAARERGMGRTAKRLSGMSI